METIALHIEYLLRYHDCVILPGFGAFIASETPAYFDREAGVFHAPVRSVCYNAAVTHDDGMLVNSFSRRLSISFEQARSLLISELKSLSDALYRDSEVTLGRLGVISMDDDGVIAFRTLTDPRTMTSAMGCTDINLSALAPEVKEQQPSADTTPSTTEAADTCTTHTTTLPAEAAQRDPRYWYIAVRKRTVNIAAALLIVLSVGLIALVPGFRHDQQPIEASMLNVEKIIDTVSSIGSRGHDKTRKDSVANYTGSKASPTAVAADQSAPSASCYLIVASFHTQSEADKFVELKKPGRYSLQIHRNGKLWLVSAERGTSAEDLLSLSTTPEFKSEYTQAWVWKPAQ